jgi:hypothetical protein
LTRGIKAERHKGSVYEMRARCVELKKACDSDMKQGFYNNLIQFGIPMTLVSLINMGVHITVVS